ncbi:MAG: GH25 family lysozyme [Paludibacter sp.]|jgi:lysozyme
MKIRLIIFFLAMLLIQLPAEAKKRHHTRHHTLYSNFVPIKVSTEGEVWGLDVSHHQSTIDWNKLSENEPHFVFLKATEGATNRDIKYSENYGRAKDNNIPVGSYHFFTYKSSGKEQAQNFLSTVKYSKGDLPPVLDLEFSRRMPPAYMVRNELLDFIQTISLKLTCFPIVYCSNRFFNLYLKECLPEKCKLWIVDYKAKPNVNWTFWQTSNKHTLPGIKGYVDLNLFNGSTSNFNELLN